MLQLKGNSTNVTSATNLSLAVAVRIRATNAGTVTVANFTDSVATLIVKKTY